MKKLLSIAFVAGLLMAALSSHAAETVHLFLRGTATKSFNPDSKVGAILGTTTPAQVNTAREAGSGLATGRRQFEPITCRKRIDKSSPLLAKALASNEVIPSAVVSFAKPAGAGRLEVYGVAKLENVKIKSIRTVPSARGGADTLEEVSFIYHNITWLTVKQVVPRNGFIDWSYNPAG